MVGLIVCLMLSMTFLAAVVVVAACVIGVRDWPWPRVADTAIYTMFGAMLAALVLVPFC